MKTLSRMAVLALIAAVSLTGCIRYEVDLTLASDSTASGEFVFALQDGVGEMMGASSQEEAFDDLFGDINLSDEFTASAYSEDGYVGTRYTFSNVPLEAFGTFGDIFAITKEGNNFVVDGQSAPADKEDLDSGMQDAMEWTLSITFPGSVSEHNGSLNGNTVTWNLATQTEPVHAVGAAGDSSGGSPLGLILGIVGGVLVLAIIAFVVVALIKRNKDASDDAFADSGVPAPPAPPVSEVTCSDASGSYASSSDASPAAPGTDLPAPPPPPGIDE